MRLEWGIVISVESEASLIQQVDISFDDGVTRSALCYPDLTGSCALADRVLVNTSAARGGSSSAGACLVVARAWDSTAPSLDHDPGGRVLKMRHTPLELEVLAVEEQASPHRVAMRAASDLAGMPVACCGVHSQVPLVAAAAKEIDPSARIVYVMQDDAALPLAVSDQVRRSTEVGLIDATVTCGNAFGGTYEAVNLHSGLLAARYVAQGDIAICASGPGGLSTATRFGHGGVGQGEALNAACALNAMPIGVLRVSFAHGSSAESALSRHTSCALMEICMGRALIGVPRLPLEYADLLEDALDAAGVWSRHRRVDTRAGSSAPPSMRGVEVRANGRGLSEAPAFFAAAFAAGEVCASITRGDLGHDG